MLDQVLNLLRKINYSETVHNLVQLNCMFKKKIEQIVKHSFYNVNKIWEDIVCKLVNINIIIIGKVVASQVK